MSKQPPVCEGGRFGGRQSGRKCGDVDDYLSDHGTHRESRRAMSNAGPKSGSHGRFYASSFHGSLVDYIIVAATFFTWPFLRLLI